MSLFPTAVCPRPLADRPPTWLARPAFGGCRAEPYLRGQSL